MSNDSWIEEARGYLPGVPAVDILSDNEALKLPPAVATGLAAAAYRIQFGQSVAIQVPFDSPKHLAKIASYLHACRVDALRGKVRTTWFCRSNMACSQDLLVWTRSQSQKPFFMADPMLQASIVTQNYNIGELQKQLIDKTRVLRTIVCQQKNTTRGFVTDLRRHVSPFAIIVDITQFGIRDDPEILAEILDEHFKDTPILWLASIGDLAIRRDLDRINAAYPMPMWRAGGRDQVLWHKNSRSDWRGKIAQMMDTRFDQRTRLAYFHIEELGKEIKEYLRPHSYQLLKKVWRELISLCVPCTFHEIQAGLTRRGGMQYASKPMSEWISGAAAQQLPSGDAQLALDRACSTLNDILLMLETGVTGRQQALLRWLGEILSGSKKGLIAVSKKSQADMLRKWMLIDYAQHLDSGAIQIVAAGTGMDPYNLDSIYDEVLILGNLWMSDLWISGFGKRVIWLAYPCEVKTKEAWSKGMRDVDHTLTDKKSWWHLEEGSAESRHESPLTVEDWNDCSGQYVDNRVFEIELPEDPSWMAGLLDDFDWEEEDEGHDSEVTTDKNHVRIRTTEKTYFFDPNRRLEILIENAADDVEPVQHKTATEVEEGDVLLVDQEDAIGSRSMLNLIIEHQTEDSAELQFWKSQAQRWRDYLHIVLSKCNGDMGKLHAKLSDLGVVKQTVENWVSGKTNRPQKIKQAIKIVAKLAGSEHTQDTLALTVEALSKINGYRSRAGRSLQAAKRAIAGGVKEASVGGLELPVAYIQELLSFEEVLAVSHHIGEVGSDTVGTLYDQCMQIVDDSDGRLVMTSQGKRSLKDSPFEDHGRVVGCFELVRDQLHKAYSKEQPIQAAIDVLARANIDFKGGMSDQTQGRYKQQYDRTYNGKRVDIGKHLGMGGSRAPQRCFRLHFHWDEDEAAVVIHHAGRHLPTQSG